MKKALFDDAENLVAKTGQDTPPSPPINPEIVAQERKVIEIERAALDTDALIVPCKGGFLMKAVQEVNFQVLGGEGNVLRVREKDFDAHGDDKNLDG